METLSYGMRLMIAGGAGIAFFCLLGLIFYIVLKKKGRKLQEIIEKEYQ
ncbi:MAG: hypothetical protein LUJ09_06465 [Firmicutes bacterium]|nr:hypothetical protein [Bacillota bacterium]